MTLHFKKSFGKSFFEKSGTAEVFKVAFQQMTKMQQLVKTKYLTLVATKWSEFIRLFNSQNVC